MNNTLSGRIDLDGGFLEWREGSGGTVEIYDIAVNSERRKGIGRAMIKELAEAYPGYTIFAFTRASNAVARLFYEALGFQGTVVEKFYQGDPAMLYVKWAK